MVLELFGSQTQGVMYWSYVVFGY